MISILKSPSKYSPAGNPLFLSVQSNDSDIVYFNISVMNPVDSSVISSSKSFVTPDDPTSATIDLSNVLDNYVSTGISIDSAFIQSFDSGVLDYSVEITEMLSTGSGLIAGDMQALPASTVYNASFADVEFQYYGYRNYYVNSITTAKFLSTKSSVSNINSWSKEFLYFLADTGSTISKAKVKVYSSTGSTTYSEDFSAGSAKLHRLNVSPKNLKTSLLIDFDDTQYFEVWLENSGGTKLTEVKRYRCINFDCRVEPVNVLWINKVGGVDSFTFINPQESKSIKRSTIQTNKYHNYSISTSGVINPSEKTYNVSQTSDYTLTTPVLNDWEYVYLSDMLSSEQVYVELTDGSLVPVKLITTSTEVKRKKYSTTSLRFELKYQAESNLNLVPDSYLSFSAGLSQIGFRVPTLLVTPNDYYETIIGDGSTIYFVVTHNLLSTNVAVDLVYVSSGQTVFGDVVRVNSNTISVEFGEAISSDSIKVMVSKLD